ncbi:CoA-transferase [Streptomyces sp. NPDC050546]|uniref:CoA-transferase n=1 Tax=Streptomyces sp. NPDC050546 TaxID=3365628 RepID=UPI0037A8BA41
MTTEPRTPNPARTASPRLCEPAELAGMVPDGATVAITGAGGGVIEADAIFAALERRFLTEAFPRDLTLVHALGVGDRQERGTNAFAHPKMVRRVIGGHWTWSPEMTRLAAEEEIEAYVLPGGVISLLLREIGARRPGLVTTTGLGTFVDPRQSGGRANAAAGDALVELVEFDGQEYLRYRPFRVDVGIVRGTAVDPNGNITLAGEAAQLDALAVAQAAKASGGIVLAQVKERLGTALNPREVHLPRFLLDAVAVVPEQKQTYLGGHDPALCGDAPAPPFRPAPTASPIRRLIARRAAAEVRTGDVMNLGFGISSEVVDVLAEQNRLGEVTTCIEQGHTGGTPLSGDMFGVCSGAEITVPSTTQFDFFTGGVLDATYLGMAEVDATGSVNVSRIGGGIIGPGGFIDISQSARRVVFCGQFTAKGTRLTVGDGALHIEREGTVGKFVRAVDEVTFSGPQALARGQEVLYVTERAVFRLVPEGVELIEVAPGISVDRDVLPHMGFTPIVRQPRVMDPALFTTRTR